MGSLSLTPISDVKILLPLFYLIALFAAAEVDAQIPRPKADCIQVCVQQKDHNWIFRPAHLARLQKIQDKKKAATSPEQLAQIEKEEEDERERYANKVQETCEDICKNNPS